MDRRGSSSSQASLSSSLPLAADGTATLDSPRMTGAGVSGRLSSTSGSAGIQGVIQGLQSKTDFEHSLDILNLFL